jgi:hypothetical protein
VVNPYARQLTFLDDRTRTRRDHTKYLSLIRCIALLYQYQRPVKTAVQGGKAIEYIEATEGDIAAANGLAHEILGRTLDEMPPQTRRLLEQIERMVDGKCSASKVERSDCLFRARELREFTGWGHSQLHLHLQRLAELEYVLSHRADHGQGFVYELVYDGGGKDGRRFLPGLIDTAKLKRPGVNGAHPAPVRAASGPVPGPVRASLNAPSSSEEPSSAPEIPENAHQERGVLAVS